MPNRSIFRAYDMRGRYPSEINKSAVLRASRALAKKFREGTVVLGHDARKSSPELYRALSEFWGNAKGFKVLRGGLMTTPMLYWLVAKKRAAGGIMVTASHNPKNMNGLKVVGKMAEPISGEEIEKLLTPGR